MSSRPPDHHQNGRREIAAAENPDAVDDAFEKLRPMLRPDKTREARVVLTRAISKFHSGPIPSAEEMEHLEQVHPGAADRCFRMAEKEQDHRHACERDIIKMEFSFRGRGQWFAMATVALLLCAVAYLAFLGDTRSAAVLGTATLVGLVTAWTASKYIDNKTDEISGKQAAPPPPAKRGKQGR